MVKFLPIVLCGVAALPGSDIDQSGMLQMSAHRHGLTKKQKGLEEFDCKDFEWQASCPKTAMQDLEDAYNEDADALDALIVSLDEDIAAEKALIEEAVNNTASIEAKTAQALGKAAKASADIIMVQDKMDKMSSKFTEKSDKLQASFDDLDAQVKRVVENTATVSQYITGNAPPGNTGLLQTKWWGGWKEAVRNVFQSIKEEVIEIVQEVVEEVVEVTEEVLDVEFDRILAYRVDEAKEEFIAKKAELEQCVSECQAALAVEEAALTEALSAQEEAKEAQAAALAEEQEMRNALKDIKEKSKVMKKANKKAISTLKADIRLVEAWIKAFKAKFGKDLFKQLARVDLVQF